MKTSVPIKRPAKFLEGNLMRHVAIMAFSASAGLLSMFAVDFIDLYFISLLGDVAITAGVGFAGTLIFFNMSVSIGLMIAVSALTARRLGRDDEEGARRIATSAVALGLMVSIVIAVLFWIFAPQLLDMIGATGDAKAHATRYLRIVVPSLPVAVFAMSSSGILRAHGDARRAMNATLAGGIVNAILDPILIFGLSFGLEGAAMASVAARFAMAWFAIAPILKHYGGFAPFERDKFREHLQPILKIAVPAVLTNIATPIGNLIVTRFIAPYGDSAIAAYAVIGRLTPLAFCVVYALSGAVGPIIGQNFGAENYARVRETVIKALIFTAAYSLFIWGVLLVSAGFIGEQFGLDQTGQNLVSVFAIVITPLFFFNGVLFIGNASFNNLGRPTWSTWLNWGKNTIGVAPFVMIGSAVGDASGVLVGQAIGGIIFAGIGILLVFRLIERYRTGKIVHAD
ncbi:MATE family efflux transporter [Parvularcula sp. IMCC14364]|uniref:MATE family efflux transporter n=1 Tax=Parvularcula sp. IMCC14364 TaxID=3067902 RepID=UPI002740C7F0|nr:MATE family efflux transporter [Parvularcula sp. IMCC14364]